MYNARDHTLAENRRFNSNLLLHFYYVSKRAGSPTFWTCLRAANFGAAFSVTEPHNTYSPSFIFFMIGNGLVKFYKR